MYNEEPVLDEEGGKDADYDNVNGTLTLYEMEGVVGCRSGNRDGDWEISQNLAPDSAFFIARKKELDKWLHLINSCVGDILKVYTIRWYFKN